MDQKSVSEKKTENFIRIYENVLSDKMVTDLVQMASQTVTWNSRSQDFRSDSQMSLDPYWPGMVIEGNKRLSNNALSHYIKDFPCLSKIGEYWCSGSMNLQKTEPLEGYHHFHAENTAYSPRFRILAWMIYLNDVEEGGETEFLYQQLKIKPKANTTVIWPAGFTHLHRGNPPISETKYILTGWFTSMPDRTNICTVQSLDDPFASK
tara:strand:- start:69 stop:689 length:621 start_codon:yes stop_codon:yes gene_type:complete